jgi:hypothetical protein
LSLPDSIFPFRLARQPIQLAGSLGQPSAVVSRILPRDIDYRPADATPGPITRLLVSGRLAKRVVLRECHYIAPEREDASERYLVLRILVLAPPFSSWGEPISNAPAGITTISGHQGASTSRKTCPVGQSASARGAARQVSLSPGRVRLRRSPRPLEASEACVDARTGAPRPARVAEFGEGAARKRESPPLIRSSSRSTAPRRRSQSTLSSSAAISSAGSRGGPAGCAR